MGFGPEADSSLLKNVDDPIEILVGQILDEFETLFGMSDGEGGLFGPMTNALVL